MLGTVLKLLRPSYALTALILFAGWQVHSFFKSIPERLSLPLTTGIVKSGQPVSHDSNTSQQVEQVPSSKTLAAIQRFHPVARILSWVAIYILVCLATVPLIKKILERESNFANAVLIVCYSAVGFLMALVFAAFQFVWLTGVMLAVSLVFSAAVIIRLAGELERMRVQNIFSPS